MVAMACRQISVDELFNGNGRIGVLGPGEEALIALLEHVGDRVRDEVVLRFEVSVERTVGQPGLGHQAGHADSIGSHRTDGRRRLTQYPVAGSLFVLVVVAHVSFIPPAERFVERDSAQWAPSRPGGPPRLQPVRRRGPPGSDSRTGGRGYGRPSAPAPWQPSGLAYLHGRRLEGLGLRVRAAPHGRELALNDIGSRADDGDGHGAVRIA